MEDTVASAAVLLGGEITARAVLEKETPRTVLYTLTLTTHTAVNHTRTTQTHTTR